jgi:uncharacterized protein YlzI (FlbEa/FlbD family)
MTSQGPCFVNRITVTTVEPMPHSESTLIGLLDGSKVAVIEMLEEVVRKLQEAAKPE